LLQFDSMHIVRVRIVAINERVIIYSMELNEGGVWVCTTPIQKTIIPTAEEYPLFYAATFKPAKYSSRKEFDILNCMRPYSML
jgi:hypothetical protein